jgi:hypothetical protein
MKVARRRRMLSSMRRPAGFVLVAVALTACFTLPWPDRERVVLPPSPPESSPATEVLVPGVVSSVELSPDMVGLESDGRTLVTTQLRQQRPAAVLSASAKTGNWRIASESDGHVRQLSVYGHWLALIESHDTGNGGFKEDVVLVDLRTGRREAVDSYSMSPATYRGGGAALRRPVGLVVVGENVVAWTRLIEEPIGKVIGELRFKRIGDWDSVPVNRSDKWLTPVSIDSEKLIYVAAASGYDEVHVYRIAEREDAVVAKAPVIFDAAVSDRWLLYAGGDSSGERAEQSGPTTVALYDMGSGREVPIENARGRSCGRPSLNARFATASCRASHPSTAPTAFDRSTETSREIVRVVQQPVQVDALRAVDDGLQWIESTGTKRYVRTLRFEGAPEVAERDRLRVCVEVARLDPSLRRHSVETARQAMTMLQTEPLYIRAGYASVPFVVDEGCPSASVLLESGQVHPKRGGDPFAVPRVERPSPYRLFAYLAPETEVSRMFGDRLWPQHAHEHVCVPWPGHGHECTEVTTEVYITPAEASSVELVRERLAAALGLRQPPY